LSTSSIFAHRLAKFSAVGAIGIGVQLITLLLLTSMGVNYLLATGIAVEAAVLHNFVWHERFTWADRATCGARQLLRRWFWFNVTTGLVSIVGNLLCMRLLVTTAHCNVLVANLVTIALCAALNFAASDRLVFVEAAGLSSRKANAAFHGAPR
jgi:putative flippase GtrA